jgi:CRISPR-associated endoribonuclease Cas6
MRFKLTLKVEKELYGDILPLNYSYECSAWIYKVLASADTIYASWLHDNGFRLGGKAFKGFTFSRLMIPEYTVSGDRIRIKSDRIVLYISFLPEKSTEQFIKGIFSEQAFRIGDVKSRVAFRVEQVELIASPVFNGEHVFETLSPLSVSIWEENGRIAYLPMDDPRIKELLWNNLLNRYRAYYETAYAGSSDFDFQLLNTPKSVLVTIKSGTEQQTRVKGYNCRFRLKAPEELMKIAYESGLGEKGSQGFGMITIKC